MEADGRVERNDFEEWRAAQPEPSRAVRESHKPLDMEKWLSKKEAEKPRQDSAEKSLEIIEDE